MAEIHSRNRHRLIIERAYAAGIAEVAPDAALRRVLARCDAGISIDGEEIPIGGRLMVVAIGKAAAPMARAVSELVGDVVSAGYVLTKDGHASGAPADFEVQRMA
jgi:glycerate 2-kinase